MDYRNEEAESVICHADKQRMRNTSILNRRMMTLSLEPSELLIPAIKVGAQTSGSICMLILCQDNYQFSHVSK
jgi:hypothetical protein